MALFKAWLSTHFRNNCYRMLLILQLSLCWFVSIIWKQLEQKEAFNSNLNLYSKVMFSGLPWWLLFPPLPMPLGKTLNGSAVYLPVLPPSFLKRSLLHLSGHLQLVPVYGHRPHLLCALPAAWHGEQHWRGPCSRPALCEQWFPHLIKLGRAKGWLMNLTGIWSCYWVSNAASNN